MASKETPNEGVEQIMRRIARVQGNTVVLSFYPGVGDGNCPWGANEVECENVYAPTGTEALRLLAAAIIDNLDKHNDRQLKRIGKRAGRIEALRKIAALAPSEDTRLTAAVTAETLSDAAAEYAKAYFDEDRSEPDD